MNLSTAARDARALMNLHGLGHVPFEFDGGKRRLGSCVSRRETGEVIKITLSRHYAELLPAEEIREVILHEIAHAKAGHKAGHGPVWKREARALGIKGDRCATPSVRPDGAYIGTCPRGHTSEMHRVPQRVRSCPQCTPGRFDKNAIYTWTKNGQQARHPAKYMAELDRVLNRPVTPTYTFGDSFDLFG